MQRARGCRIINAEMDALGQLLDELAGTLPEDRSTLRRLKRRVAAATGTPLARNDALLARYREDVGRGARRSSRSLERLLTLNAVRSQSGIAVVTVITEPYPCPGRCVYCPTEAHAPKSYLTNEPAVMRAVRSDYDPFRQVWTRLETLAATGHPTDKIELTIKGGTWSFYPATYQREFIQRCLDAANEFAQGSGFGAPGQPTIQHSERSPSLEDAQARNETAASRIIGITIETRPDYVDAAELLRLRRLGVTRVELGVQSLEDAVLERVVRDHGTAEVRQATRWLKDAGFKVAYHLMPNLPGATPASDLESFRGLFTGGEYQPDAVKLYPCVVIGTAELFQWWREGRYVPYDDEVLVELLIRMKQVVPPYVRIERVIRDIPSTSIRAGCQLTNLREEVLRRLRARGGHCRCLRCRQVREGWEGAWQLTRRDYEASEGREVFLSYEDPLTDRVASFLRLRLPSARQREVTRSLPALEGAALVRELHTYGTHLPLRGRADDAAQHQGFGRRLLAEAERIAAAEFGYGRMAVIAGIGARDYYRRFGYAPGDTYMVKVKTIGDRH